MLGKFQALIAPTAADLILLLVSKDTSQFLLEATFSYSSIMISFRSSLTSSDINECSSDPSPCDENANCTNSGGSYTCTCKQGFDGDGSVCQGKRSAAMELKIYLESMLTRCRVLQYQPSC